MVGIRFVLVAEVRKLSDGFQKFFILVELLEALGEEVIKESLREDLVHELNVVLIIDVLDRADRDHCCRVNPLLPGDTRNEDAVLDSKQRMCQSGVLQLEVIACPWTIIHDLGSHFLPKRCNDCQYQNLAFRPQHFCT